MAGSRRGAVRRALTVAPAVRRYSIEATAASATITMGMLCFFRWLRRRRDLWLLLSGAFFGFSLYSYAITKAFLPLLIALLIVLYRRELKAVATEYFADSQPQADAARVGVGKLQENEAAISGAAQNLAPESHAEAQRRDLRCRRTVR
jgi:hypothetical protein